MREDKSQRKGKSRKGEEKEMERKEEGGEKETMVRKRGRETEQLLGSGWTGGGPNTPPALPPNQPHRPSVGLSSLPHQPHSWLCRHSWQVRKRSQLLHRGSECTLQDGRCGGVTALYGLHLPLREPFPLATQTGPYLSSQPRQPPCGYRAR